MIVEVESFSCFSINFNKKRAGTVTCPYKDKMSLFLKNAVRHINAVGGELLKEARAQPGGNQLTLYPSVLEAAILEHK